MPIDRCDAEIKRRGGIYGFHLCQRRATSYLTVKSAGSPITLYYCARHLDSHTRDARVLIPARRLDR